MREAVVERRWFGASVTGAAHLADRLPCQDAHRITRHAGGPLILAISDGAGSAVRAEEGSACAVEQSVTFLQKSLSDKPLPTTKEEWRLLLHESFLHARYALVGLAEAAKMSDYATTLIVSVLTESWFATMQVGDGGVVCRSSSGELLTLSPIHRREYINETSFLTAEDAMDHVHFAACNGDQIESLAMFTDGIEWLALHYPDHTPHGPFFDALFTFARQEGSTNCDLEQFLLSDRVCERTDDDKTLLVVVRV